MQLIFLIYIFFLNKSGIKTFLKWFINKYPKSTCIIIHANKFYKHFLNLHDTSNECKMGQLDRLWDMPFWHLCKSLIIFIYNKKSQWCL